MSEVCVFFPLIESKSGCRVMFHGAVLIRRWRRSYPWEATAHRYVRALELNPHFCSASQLLCGLRSLAVCRCSHPSPFRVLGHRAAGPLVPRLASLHIPREGSICDSQTKGC